MVEIISVVDEKNRPVTDALRELVVQSGLWRRASGGIIFDAKRNKVLCHRRSSSKDERPNFWVATFGGKMHACESVMHAAERELHEEFGINHDSAAFVFIGMAKSTERRQFEYIFAVIIDSNETVITADPTEISESAWIEAGECKRRLRRSSDWYSYGYEVQIIQFLSRFSSTQNTHQFYPWNQGLSPLEKKTLYGTHKNIYSKLSAAYRRIFRHEK